MTSFFFSHPHYIGIDLQSSSLRIAKLAKKGRGWEILSLNEISTKEQIHLFHKQLKGAYVVSTLNARDLLLRLCEIPLKKEKDLLATLDFHVEPLLPYPPENAIIQYQINEQVGNSSFLSIFAVRKDRIAHHLEQLKQWDIDPEAITSKAHALVAFSKLLPPTQGPLLLVHEGKSEISFVLSEKKRILAFRAIDNKKDLKSEIQKTWLHLTSSFKSKTIDSIIMLSKNGEIKELIQEASGQNVSLPTTPLLNQNSEDLINYGLAIGSAMAYEISNFRKKEFSYPKPFKHLKKPLAAFATFSLILAGTIYFCSERALTEKKLSLGKNFSSLVHSLNASEKMTIPKTAQDYSKALNELEDKVRHRPDPYPLLPLVPKVKEMLGWLASLQESSNMVFESFNYQLVKQPDFSHKKEKYRVRVDMEVSSPSANEAKLFHDALKQANPFIDLNEEITWSSLKGKYKATFFLKDKTRYL